MTDNYPNFFLVGASKSGTTAVAEALDQHPEISMSAVKEPRFFNKFDHPLDIISQESFSQYINTHFGSNSSKVRGEASVDYLSSSRAAEWLSHYFPKSKILIILRNPIDRTKSLYEMATRHGFKESFQYAIRENGFLIQQNTYYEKVKSYLDRFPREQILILEHSDVREDWVESIRRILHFLEVDINEIPPFIERNIGGVPVNAFWKKIANRKLIALTKRFIPREAQKKLDNFLKSRYYKKIDVSTNDELYMRDFYVQDTILLDQLLGTHFQERWFQRNNAKSPGGK
ncbi:MAG: sulfotransferase family protein [Planctomycetota bacterium]|jgi:hypothetical protein